MKANHIVLPWTKFLNDHSFLLTHSGTSSTSSIIVQLCYRYNLWHMQQSHYNNNKMCRTINSYVYITHQRTTNIKYHSLTPFNTHIQSIILKHYTHIHKHTNIHTHSVLFSSLAFIAKWVLLRRVRVRVMGAFFSSSSEATLPLWAGYQTAVVTRTRSGFQLFP